MENFFDNVNNRVIDNLKETICKGSKVSIAAAQLLRSGDAMGAKAVKLMAEVPADLSLNLQIPSALLFFVIGAGAVVAQELLTQKKSE